MVLVHTNFRREHHSTFPFVLQRRFFSFNSIEVPGQSFPVCIPLMGDQFAGKAPRLQFDAIRICRVDQCVHSKNVGGDRRNMRVDVGIILSR
jgi:hypothetical protein